MTSPRLPPGIQVRDLSLRFGQQIVFDRLSFDIAGGSFVALLGASGAGKTSLLKIIAGLERATSGTVTGSDGLPIAGRIAYMGQKDLLYPWLTVEENVALGARLRGETPDRAWAAHLLERVGLAAHGRSLPAALSGGMRQRAAITRAEIQSLAAELLAQNTVLLITHDPMEACRLSHRLLVLSPWPLGLDDSHRISGQPPRAPDDAGLLKSQAELLQQLVRAAQ
ncbi:ABC transporter ATP-binding protein [Serratia sp. IR-2025]